MNKQNQYPEMLFEDKAPNRERIENRLADLKVRYQNLLFELNNSNILDIDKIFVHRNTKDCDFNSEKLINKINENVDIQEKVSALQKSIANRLANIEKLNDLELNKTKYEDLKNEVEKTLNQFNAINDYPTEQKIVVDNSQNIDLVISKMDTMAKELGEKINDLIMSQEETNEFKEEILILRSQVDNLLHENVSYKNRLENLIKENSLKENELNESFKAWTRNTNKLDELESLLNIQKSTLDEYDSEKNDLINYLEGKINELTIENYEPEKNRNDFISSNSNYVPNEDNYIFLENNNTENLPLIETQENIKDNNNSYLDDQLNQKRMLILEFTNDIKNMFVSIDDSLNKINWELNDCFNKKDENNDTHNSEINLENLKNQLDNIEAFDNTSLSVNSYQVMNSEDLYKIVSKIKAVILECQSSINKTESEIKNYCSKFDLTLYPIVVQEFNNYYDVCLSINDLIVKEIEFLDYYIELLENDKSVSVDLSFYNASSWIRVKDLINLLIDKNKTLYKLFFEITYLRDKTTDVDLDIDNQKMVEKKDETKPIIQDSNYIHALFENSSQINIPDSENSSNEKVEKNIDEKLDEFRSEINEQINGLSEKLLDQIKQIGNNYINVENNKYKTSTNQQNKNDYELIKNLKLKVVLTELEKIKKEIDLYENQELSDILNHIN